ncbi:MAG: hypothetical protein J1E40_11500 [Oscillospiraceae bacterium]|nr:hypothetical protein [Oscillospiraceae bacterium]
MKKLRKVLRSVLALAVGVTTAVSMSGCGKSYETMIQEQPEEYISMASENTVKSVVKENFANEYKILSDALKDGTFTFEFEAEGIKFSGECYTNEKDWISSQLYTLTGNKGTSASIYAYTDKNLMKFGTEGKSGSHIYDINYDTLKEKLASSIFAPDSGSMYALDDSDYETFLELAVQIDSVIRGEEKSGPEYEEIIKAYFDEHPPVTEENTDVTINGETVQGNVFRYDIPKEDIYDLVSQIVDEALKYEKNIVTSTDYSEEEIKEEMMSGFDDYDDYKLSIVYSVNSKTNELMQVNIDVSVAEKQPEKSDSDEDYYYNWYMNNKAVYYISLNAVFGADPANAEKQSFTFKMDVDYYDDSEYFEDSYMVISADVVKSENKTEVTITSDDNGEFEALATIICEKNGDNYTVTLDVPEEDITAKMEGTIVTDNNSFTMTIDRVALVEGSAEVAYSPKIVIGVKKGGEILVLDAEKEFLDITEDEMDALIENAEADFEAVFEEYAEDSAMGNYIKKSKMSSANANAKMVHTALASHLVQIGIDNVEIKGDTIEGKGYTFTIDGKKVELPDYLGEEFSGYSYAEINPETYAVYRVVWSEDPIPDEYKRQISYDEQESLANDGILIGCYPLG